MFNRQGRPYYRRRSIAFLCRREQPRPRARCDREVWASAEASSRATRLPEGASYARDQDLRSRPERGDSLPIRRKRAGISGLQSRNPSLSFRASEACPPPAGITPFSYHNRRPPRGRHSSPPRGERKHLRNLRQICVICVTAVPGVYPERSERDSSPLRLFDSSSCAHSTPAAGESEASSLPLRPLRRGGAVRRGGPAGRPWFQWGGLATLPRPTGPTICLIPSG